MSYGYTMTDAAFSSTSVNIDMEEIRKNHEALAAWTTDSIAEVASNTVAGGSWSGCIGGTFKRETENAQKTGRGCSNRREYR